MMMKGCGLVVDFFLYYVHCACACVRRVELKLVYCVLSFTEAVQTAADKSRPRTGVHRCQLSRIIRDSPGFITLSRSPGKCNGMSRKPAG